MSIPAPVLLSTPIESVFYGKHKLHRSTQKNLSDLRYLARYLYRVSYSIMENTVFAPEGGGTVQ